jgi:hypothetical protein
MKEERLEMMDLQAACGSGMHALGGSLCPEEDSVPRGKYHREKFDGISCRLADYAAYNVDRNRQ